MNITQKKPAGKASNINDEIKITKEHVNIGTIGHVDHGKSTLTSAISFALQEFGTKYVPYSRIDKAPEERKRGITISVAHVKYISEKRQYASIDCPGHADYIKNMIVGASQMDIAILVISCTDGVMTQTSQHVILAKQSGINDIIVYFNKFDIIAKEYQNEPEMIMAVKEGLEESVNELLTKYKFDLSRVKFFFGSALKVVDDKQPSEERKAEIDNIISMFRHIDSIPVKRDYDSGFMMPIEDVFGIRGRGTVVTGSVKRGVLNLDKASGLGVPVDPNVDIVGFNSLPNQVVTGIEGFNETKLAAIAGDNVGLLIRGVSRDQVCRGQVVVKKGSLKPSSSFIASIYIFSKDNGGRSTPFSKFYTPQFYINTTDVTGRIVLEGSGDDNSPQFVSPGDLLPRVKVEIKSKVLVEVGFGFSIREGGKTIGVGKIIDLVND